MVLLKRKHIFLSGIGLILLFYFLNKGSFLYDTSGTPAKCLGYEVIYPEGRRKSADSYYAILEYKVNNQTYKIKGIENLKLEEGEIVTVVYKNKNPEDAYQYSFFGFWYYGILYSALSLVLLTIICYGVLDERHSVKLNLPFLKSRGEKSELPSTKK